MQVDALLAQHPCAAGEFCNEDTNVCDECQVAADCADGLYCNGDETCAAGACVAGTYQCDADQNCQEEDDGVSCENKVGGNLQITKATVKAGKDEGGDSIELSGIVNASEEDLDAAVGDTIIVSLEAEYIPGDVIEYEFPIAAGNIKKGKYTSPKDQDQVDPETRLEIDTVKETIKFSAKKDDLTGLSCPITVRVDILEWWAEDELEDPIVNGTKPCPLPLLMYVDESLEVTKVKAKKGSEPESDSISIEGTFTIDGFFDEDEPVIIKIGSNTFTVPAAAFDEKNGSYKCNSAESGNGLVTATFDYVKATYKISIKNADLSAGGAFSIDIFGNLLEATDPVNP